MYYLDDTKINEIITFLEHPLEAPKEEEVEVITASVTDAHADEMPKLSDKAADYWEYPYLSRGYKPLKDKVGLPGITPPWGTLTAIDLNKGAIKWQIPLGHHPKAPDDFPNPSGTENYGGPVLNAGGLLFIAATMDEKIRAFQQDTGELLWEASLPAGGYATPALYGIDGRQYLVIACGGTRMGTPTGDAYVAFALPN